MTASGCTTGSGRTARLEAANGLRAGEAMQRGTFGGTRTVWYNQRRGPGTQHDRVGGLMEKDPESYNVRAVERAMQVLSTFDSEHEERGVSEVAQITGLHKATTHRIMMTLLNGGFLERAADGERFRLGLRLVELGLGALQRLDLRHAALPYMEELVERFGESCDLGIFDRGEVLYIEVVHSEHSLTIAARVGRRLPAYCTASGRVFLAFLPEEVVKPVLDGPLSPCTEKTTTSCTRLLEELEVTRQRGYAIDDEELEVGIRAVSAPIHDIDGNVIAALSIPGPVHRMPPERIPEIARALIEATDAISTHVLRA
ncbi:MAG: IclR family transcriptional regulator [Anaerolineae bacterium]|nr:IclR family transcriptional regulator [Anaerolineae bacterium]